MMWYVLLVAAVAAERIAELVVARRNERWSMARGATVAGQGHYPAMVALHTGLLAACVAEVWLGGPTVPARARLGHGCRTGGRPGAALVVHRDPGSALEHPGDRRPRPAARAGRPVPMAAASELCGRGRRGVALPLVHTAWLTALAFTLLNAVLLTVRIRCENAALVSAAFSQRAARSGPAGNVTA